MKKPKHMLTGVNIGDYGFDPDKVMDQLKKYKIGKNNGGVFTFVRFRVDQKRPTTEQLREWAETLRENEVHFMVVNNYPRVGDLYTTLTKDENKNTNATVDENGKLTGYKADVDTDAAFTGDTEVVKDGYFNESEYRCAPYFDIQIDGITLLNVKF